MRPLTYLGVPIDSVGRSGGTEHAPEAFRASSRPTDPWLARDAGDLDVQIRGEIRDPTSGVIAIDDVVATTHRVSDAVADLTASDETPFLMGGCCALLPGALAGARRSLGDVGLVSLDGHLDLYDGTTSPTGEAADMPISVVLGRGPAAWVEAAGATVPPRYVWLLGPRDLEEALSHGHPHPADIAGLTFVDADAVRRAGPAATGTSTVRNAAADPGRFWLHVDVDVLDQAAFPATDYLMDGGLQLAELAALLQPLVRSPSLAGASVGCFNPDKDLDGANGAALAEVFRTAFGS